jgi:predicted dehydrogenase
MNILIVGLGSIAAKHITALQALHLDVNLYALRSSPEWKPYAGVKSIFALEEICEVLDFAIISNPTSLHYEVIKSLSGLSVPLFVEKPLVDSVKGLEDLVSLVESKKIVSYVACNLRFHPCITYLKKNIQDSTVINEVNVYCGSYLPDWRPATDYKQSYSANRHMGGGVHLDLFHELDYLMWIFGLPSRSRCILSTKSSLRINAADYANYLLEYTSFNASVVLNYYRRTPKRQIEILFEDTTWIVDLIACEIRDGKGSIVYSDQNYTIIDTYKSQLNYFIRCLNDKKIPMNNIQESAEILKICLINDN